MKRFGILIAHIVTVFILSFISFNQAFASISDYAGVYNGTYEGMDKGRWVLKIESDGTSYIGAWSDVHKMGEYAITQVNKEGEVFYEWLNRNYVYFKINQDGSVGAENGNTLTGVIYATGTGKKNDSEKIATYIGDYEGQYKGDDSGSIYFKVNNDGAMSGSFSSKETGESGFGVGAVAEDGEVFAVAENDTIFSGKINSNGKVTGDWYNYYYNAGGTLSAVREGSSAANNDKGGGGGGGCFINILR